MVAAAMIAGQLASAGHAVADTGPGSITLHVQSA
ncbi:MAG: hypothetical protein QOF92_4504, partial [Pseudonocardiales bacterium]|nr:hypothetical protein [Pseudonocardiales bacterium]